MKFTPVQAPHRWRLEIQSLSSARSDRHGPWFQGRSRSRANLFAPTFDISCSLPRTHHRIIDRSDARHEGRSKSHFTTEAQSTDGSTSSPRADFLIAAHPEPSRRTRPLRLRGEFSSDPYNQ